MIYGVVVGQDDELWMTAWTISISRKIHVSRFRTLKVICRVNRQNKTTRRWFYRQPMGLIDKTG